MRFRDQLLLLGAAGIVAMLAMAAIGFWGQIRLAAAAERIAATTNALHNHQTAVAMHAGLRADALDALVASFLADPSSGARIEQALQDHTDGLRNALSRNAALPLEAEVIAEIRALYDDGGVAPDDKSASGPVNEFVLVVNDIFTIATEEDPYSATAVMPVYTNAFHTVESGLKTLGARFEAMHNAQINEIADVRRQVITAQGIGLAVFAVGLVLASLTIVRRVMDQLGGEPAYAAEVVSRIAAGDFSRDVEVTHGGRSLLGDMKDLRNRLRDFIHAQIELGAAFKQGDTDMRLPADQVQGSYREMAEAVNIIAEELLAVQAKVLETTAHYAAGDFSVDMQRLPGKQASITAAMDQVKGQLSAIKNDILRLSAAASRGDFSARGDASRFEHEFREMVVALNRLMTEADAGLGDVGRLLQALASGDLTQSVDSMYSGAFGVLAANANATVIQLTGIIDRIRIATHAIQGAALDISAGNADLSLRTERQAANLEETASSMKQLTTAVQKNADNSRQARELAAGAAQIAVRGGKVVDDVVVTMNGISASSRKIGDIIGVIDGIAFQTNILALNAAVEAARAGEQGRGFAVVATEVRSLAQRSADAAREIKSLISESVGTVQTGAALVDAAGKTMHEIVAAVERVSTIMGDISKASEEQAAGIERVNESVARMDDVTQQNAVMVERATAAAAALKQQSDSLAKAVSTFKLTSTEGIEGLGSGDLSMWEM